MIQFYLTLFLKTINNITTNETFGFKPMWVEKALLPAGVRDEKYEFTQILEFVIMVCI